MQPHSDREDLIDTLDMLTLIYANHLVNNALSPLAINLSLMHTSRALQCVISCYHSLVLNNQIDPEGNLSETIKGRANSACGCTLKSVQYIFQSVYPANKISRVTREILMS